MLKELLKPEIQAMIKDKKWLELKNLLINWPAPDIADLLVNLEEEDMVILFRLLPRELSYDVFSELDSDKQMALLNQMTNEQVKTIISELDPDDRTRLFEELPGKIVKKFLNLLPPEERRESLQLLGYPENSVGRLMTPDYVAVKSDWTIEQALEHIRKYGQDAETINMVYVIDENSHLLDEIPLRRLILADPQQKVNSLMDYKVIYIQAHADQEEAIRIMEHYDLISLPVVDSEKVLLGIVTIDDIIDVLEEEQTEDITKLSAVNLETPYLSFITDLRKIPLRKLYRSRVSWLLLLLLMDLFTGGIIRNFETTIAKYVVLVTFLPVLVDTAGNAGSQSATLVIRAMALGSIMMKDWLILLSRELIIATGLGLTMGIGISIMGIVRGGYKIAQVVVTAMIVNVIVGSLIGIMLPFIFTKFKKDPATASTPLITTLSDIIGTGVYLGIAYLFLA